MTGSARRDLRFAVVGAGMSGIASAVLLREAGFDGFVLYEKADRLGGTWRENTYPGIACDVPSHLYSYSFAPNPEWSHRYSPGAEIQAYLEDVARRREVMPRIRFGREVVRCAHDDGRWRLTLSDGSSDVADVVIAATGVLHHPNLPSIPGLESFRGAKFHCARWNHEVALDGRRVGVVGTGASAVQIVPSVIDRVRSLVLFQRTPQWIMPTANPAYGEDEKAAFRAHPETMRAVREEISRMFCDGFANILVDPSSPILQAIHDACVAHLETAVGDSDLRERLRPDYRAACKRLVISGTFYEAIQRPHASLVSEPIERIEPEGPRTRDGRLHALDVLVFATGFRVDQFVRPIEVIGRDGASLDSVWRENPYAYQSVAVPGFPNFFFLNGPNSPVGNFSLIDVAELQLGYVLQLAQRIRSGECRELSPSPAAMAAFDAARREAARATIWGSGCRSWYLDRDGIPTAWPWTFDRFREEMSAPRFEDWES